MHTDDWLQTEYTELKDAGLFRHLRTVMSAPSGTINLDGREVILLGSNNYLGLSTHPQVIAAAVAATEEFGTGSSGSRLISGNNELYTTLETNLAKTKGTEAALVFSSGYAANTSIIPVLVGENDLILSDELNHASIIDGCRLSRATKKIYRHCDVEHLQNLLIESSDFRRRLIITDGVFSMDGDIAPLSDIYKVATNQNAMLLVDDAHGFGVLGKDGSGTVAHFGIQGEDIIQMGTLSKAIGGLGGYVAGSRTLIDLLINRARGFIFTTGLPPGTLAAADAALKVMRSTPKLRQRLLKNAETLKTALIDIGYTLLPSQTQILPVLLGEPQRATEVAEALLLKGVYAPAIRPPAVPTGSSRLRVTVMATHTDVEIHKAINGFADVQRSL
ncbi:8-amino-7-oxononanoate synthase [Candidatus Poribacteria bacterium]|nr:8-amino-7-oxononanoate synthase [Candidatus Poribacteria bacterium]MYB63373.1 8-amino-7-oxononanoate synthase [Candidatus Poribacteria bacterium]MYF54715.1 8-amino-7-oxononanoate synthase [Candidatus Poribacteria bacterium]MYI93795.1 8-amino-7-oxononanoate synthase [Candidatus Poribacteria bacterium]